MAGRGFGAGSAPARAWVSWLSWDLSGSSQPLNFNLSKIFGVPQAILLLGVGGIAPGTAGFLHDVEALSILAPIPHPCPHPTSLPPSCILAPIPHPPRARTWKTTQTRGAGEEPPRASPALQSHKRPCRFPYGGFALFSLAGARFHPPRCVSLLLHGVSKGPWGRFCRRSRGPEGCRGGRMGGGAAAHAKMHQPVFFWWRLKVVCAVSGMIQCSWRRCTTRRPGTCGAIGWEGGDPGIHPEASFHLIMSHIPPPKLLWDPIFDQFCCVCQGVEP